MSVVFKAPAETPHTSLFLAGSIDMGAAIDWQKCVEEALKDEPVVIFNPRRDDWDSSWKQDIKNDKFRQQVEWELEHLEKADIICFYFDSEGLAPITLMELGLFAMSGKKMCVYCPEGYWRRGNVQIVCDRYGIVMPTTIDAFIDWIKIYIHKD